ncbi:Protein OS-9 [Thecaphora frezii]
MAAITKPASILALASAALFGLLAILASAATAPFPQDIFARPAFRLHLGPQHDAHFLPVRNHTAVAIMQQQQQQHRRRVGLSWDPSPLHQSDTSTSSLAVAASSASEPSDKDPQAAPSPLSWTLHRSGPTTAHLCAISDFTAADSSPRTDVSTFHNATSALPRQALVARALKLLEPLKQMCLFHTIDWFTYSFCHGKEVRQFRALTQASAAEAASAHAGGGAEGKKAAVRAAAEVAKLRKPVADPAYDSFTLGRWKPENDQIVDEADSRRGAKSQGTLTQHHSASKTLKDSVSTAIGTPSGTGTELVEVVQFGDWDEEELHAEESRIFSRLSSSSDSIPSIPEVNLNRQRYISQTWSDGTLCDINNQPRSIEVQFHCGNRKGLGDQIVAIKETTICNYVIVIETSRLCTEPAFRGGNDDKVHPVTCHKVVGDDWEGIALGDQQDFVDVSPHSYVSTEPELEPATEAEDVSDSSYSEDGDDVPFSDALEDFFDHHHLGAFDDDHEEELHDGIFIL